MRHRSTRGYKFNQGPALNVLQQNGVLQVSGKCMISKSGECSKMDLHHNRAHCLNRKLRRRNSYLHLFNLFSSLFFSSSIFGSAHRLRILREPSYQYAIDLRIPNVLQNLSSLLSLSSFGGES